MSQYVEIFEKELEKYAKLTVERSRIDAEMQATREMLKASFGLMTDSERSEFRKELQAIIDQNERRDSGLTSAIRSVMQSNADQWFTSTKMRQELLARGFDFSGYTSNPLSSIRAILKRLPADHVRTRENSENGFEEFRWHTTGITAAPPPMNAGRQART